MSSTLNPATLFARLNRLGILEANGDEQALDSHAAKVPPFRLPKIWMPRAALKLDP
jgi:hypothetical protein